MIFHHTHIEPFYCLLLTAEIDHDVLNVPSNSNSNKIRKKSESEENFHWTYDFIDLSLMIDSDTVSALASLSMGCFYFLVLLLLLRFCLHIFLTHFWTGVWKQKSQRLRATTKLSPMNSIMVCSLLPSSSGSFSFASASNFILICQVGVTITAKK